MDETKNQILVTDIFRRMRIKNNVMNASFFYDVYRVQDGERPEHIADRVYGSSEYHWVILMMNDIVDPFHDWPLGVRQEERFMEAKYPGYALLLANAVTIVDITDGRANVAINTQPYDDETNFVAAANGDYYLRQSNTDVVANIVFYDSTNKWLYINNISKVNTSSNVIMDSYSNLIQISATGASNSEAPAYAKSVLVYRQQGGFQYNANVKVTVSQSSTGANGNVISWNSSTQQLVVQMKPGARYKQTVGTTALSNIRQTSTNISGIIQQTVLNTDAVHHYENAYGQEVPRGYVNRKVIKNAVFDLGTSDSRESVTNTPNGIDLSKGPVTNRQYEESRNEGTREIKILKPEFLERFVSEFQALMGS